MKFLEAFKDAAGFHYRVQLDDEDPPTIKDFNYGPVPAEYCTGFESRPGVDPTGQPMLQQKRDQDGNVVYEPVTDKDGKDVKDADGNPILREVVEPVMVTVPVFVQESEAEYTARIEAEIEATCILIAEGAAANTLSFPVAASQIPLDVKGKEF